MTDNRPRCPVCGQIMYQTRRGATLRKHKPALRVWEEHELGEVQP